MSKSVVQATAGQYFNNVSTSSNLTALSSTTTAGNSIYVLINGTHTSGFDVSGVTDTAGNTYAEVVQSGLDENSSRGRALIWAAHDIAAQASNVVTITYSNASANYAHATAVEVSATGGVQSTDQTGSDTDPTDDASITATCGGANADAEAIVFGVAGTFTGANSPVPSLPTGHTNLYSYTPGAGTYRPSARHSYQILSGAETTSATWTVTGNTSYALYAALATFQEPALIKYVKIIADSSAASATGIEVIVYSAPSGSNYIAGTTRYGSANSKSFEASLESGNAVLKVLASDVGCSGLAASTAVAALARNTTYTTGMVEATIIEE